MSAASTKRLCIGILLAVAMPVAAETWLERQKAARDFLDLLHRWQAGDESAVTELAGWPEKRLRAANSVFVAGTDDCNPLCLKAAALFHTRVVLHLLGPEVKPAEDLHYILAETLLLTLKPPDFFHRDWLMAVGQTLREREYPQAALGNFVQVVKVWRDDAGALVAAGAIFEMLDAMPQRNWIQAYREPRPRCDDELREAEFYYSRALDGDPNLGEARLRLGRVLARRGERAAAAEILRGVVAAESRPDIRAFAWLFLGDVEERAGRTEAAASAYREALSADAALYPARVALAHVLHRAGKPDEAGAALREALAPGDDAMTWRRYHALLLTDEPEPLRRLEERLR